MESDNLSKKQIKILRYICKHPYVSFSNLALFKKVNGSALHNYPEAEEIVNYLAKEKYISCRIAPSAESDIDKIEMDSVEFASYLCPLDKGKAYIENLQRDKHRCMNAFAIIGVIGTIAGVIIAYFK